MQNKSPSILFICPYPVGQAPSQRFRFEQYLGILSEAGFQIEIASFLDPFGWTILYMKARTFQKMVATVVGFVRRLWLVFARAPRFDYIFIHREATPIGPPVVEWLLSRVFKKKIIYDFDDAIWLPNTSEENKIASALKMHGKVRNICKWSYKISCGNQYLCDFARSYNSDVILVPTTVDTENLHNPALYDQTTHDGGLTIGWTGTHSTMKYLHALVPVLGDLERHFPGQLRFLVVADRKPEIDLASLVYLKWNKQTEIKDLLMMDIGLMPLTDDLWAKGKCGFKALQYMSMGIPTIASPVGVNTTIIDQGENGYLCDSPAEWRQKLGQLIVDKELRHRMGHNGREKAVRHYSVISNTPTFLALFS